MSDEITNEEWDQLIDATNEQRAKPAASPWKPFSDAPKDGSTILVISLGCADLWHWSVYSHSWRRNNGSNSGDGTTATYFAYLYPPED